jgi:hypothetical protein
MTSTNDWNNTTSVTVVAYFSNADDAQNAINELVDEGFPADEIGAVFHSRSGAFATGFEAGTISSPSRPYHDEMTQVGSVGSAAGTSGAASDTSGVTPAGLSTGAGTGFSGASRPGPIPGSEIPKDLYADSPSSIRSPETARFPRQTQPDLDASYGGLSAPSAGYDRSRDFAREDRSVPEASWWDKLKHIFSGDADTKREPQSEKSVQSYGTGEGRLGVAEYDYPYSGSAFESSFGSMGIPEARARRLSSVILRGGAIVTVIAGSRLAEAERILESNHGQIREESGSLAQDEASFASSEPSRVQVFGRVQRVYPGYISSDQPTRKVS